MYREYANECKIRYTFFIRKLAYKKPVTRQSGILETF